MRNRILLGGLILAAVLSAVVVAAYTLQQDTLNGALEVLKWPPSGQPTFTWEINPATGSKVDLSGGSVETAMQNAFASWTGAQVKQQSITSFTVQEGPHSALNNPNGTDCMNVVSFEPTSVAFSTGIVAETFVGSVTHTLPYTYVCGGNNLNGILVAQIIGADMVFNPAYCFSTSQSPPSSFLATCPGGAAFDVQAIGTHEVGHMLGLDHSGLGHATMFPFGDTGTSAQRTVWVDDAVGAAFLYPNGSFATVTGTVAGKVTLSGNGAFASHVVLLDQQTGVPVTDGLTAPDGTYALNGTPPGNYYLIALPLSGVYTIDNFGLWACGYASGAVCTGVPSNPVNYSGTFF
ncbi:MAG: matrixin family metalloprotease [Terriglobia bacterium]